MGDEGKTVTATQTSDPWSGQQPFLTEGFGRAQAQLNSNVPQYYPGQTVTDTPGQTSQGQFNAFDQATRANDLNRYTMGGGFLSAGNPYFQGMVDQVGRAIRPGIDSAFASSGRIGSGAHANAFASALADQAGKLAYQNYDTERGRQVAASQDYSAPEAMMGVGQQMEAKQGEYLADAAKRWDFEQNKDANKLAQYMNLIGNRSYGGQQTTTQPYTGNTALQTFGTGLAGLGALGQGIPGLLSLFK